MSQAVVDPEQLRQFASHLKLFAEELRGRSTVLAAQMNQLQQSWPDESTTNTCPKPQRGGPILH